VARQQVYTLSENDIKALRDLMRKVKDIGTTTKNRPHVPPAIPNATDCYIALVPAGGIGGMALSPYYTTLEFPQGNLPSFNTCDIYHLEDGDLGKELMPAGFTENVYNLSVNPIAGGTWVQVTKDKFGTWWAETAVGGNPSEGDYTGTGTGTGSDHQTSCDPIELIETEIWCVDNLGTTGTGPKQGDLQLFERTITLDIMNGCLTKSTGAWRYVRTVGCCDPSCISDGNQTGTGTGTGTNDGGTPVPTPQPCTGFPTVSSATFTNKTGDCTCLPDNPSISGGTSSPVVLTTMTCPGNVTLTLDCTGGFIALTTGTGGIVITLVSASSTLLVYDITGYGANCGTDGGARLTLIGTF